MKAVKPAKPNLNETSEETTGSKNENSTTGPKVMIQNFKVFNFQDVDKVKILILDKKNNVEKKHSPLSQKEIVKTYELLIKTISLDKKVCFKFYNRNGEVNKLLVDRTNREEFEDKILPTIRTNTLLKTNMKNRKSGLFSRVVSSTRIFSQPC